MTFKGGAGVSAIGNSADWRAHNGTYGCTVTLSAMRRGALIATAFFLLSGCGYPTAMVADGVIEVTLTDRDGYAMPCLRVTATGPGNVKESKTYCDEVAYSVLAVTDTLMGAVGFTAVMYDESVFLVALTDSDGAVAGIMTTEAGDPWSVGLDDTHVDDSVLVVTVDGVTKRLTLASGEAATSP